MFIAGKTNVRRNRKKNIKRVSITHILYTHVLLQCIIIIDVWTKFRRRRRNNIFIARGRPPRAYKSLRIYNILYMRVHTSNNNNTNITRLLCMIGRRGWRGGGRRGYMYYGVD